MTRLLPPPRPRAFREPVVPMINVVFLLLIFFLMTASLTPADPVPVTLPQASGDTPAEPGAALYLTADGETALGSLRGPEAEAAAASAGPVLLRADRAAPAQALAVLLSRLAALGADDISVITEAPE